MKILVNLLLSFVCFSLSCSLEGAYSNPDNVHKDTYELTAYTAGFESTGKRPGHPLYGVTASGRKVKTNTTIACPPEMDFGTKVYIPYFDNMYTCFDRGGAIKGKRIDVYMPKLKDALRFGRKELEVIVYNNSPYYFN